MTDSWFRGPDKKCYFEDYVPGSVREFGAITVEQAEIIDFAKRYDPQVFHTDPEAAKNTIFGGLVASGWHTAALAMRLIVQHYLSAAATLGSPGIDELRWLKPVRPNDVISVRLTILETRPSRSKSDRGVIRSFIEVLNQNGEVVLSWKGMNMVLRK